MEIGFVRAALAGLALWFVPQAQAETLLRWKFTPGQTLRYEFRQSTRSETTGAGKPTVVALEMTMQLAWMVEPSDDQGTGTINQTIEKLGISMQVDELPPIVYDSSSRTPPTGPAKEIADSVGVLIGAACKLKLSGRGELTSVEPSEPLRQAWEKAKAGNLFTPEGLTRILRQSSIMLPEQAVEPGAKWDATDETASPLGTLRLASQYEYLGKEEYVGQMRDKISAATDIQLQANRTDLQGPVATLKESNQTGTLWFDSDAGHFVASEFQQRLVTERPYRDMTIRVRTSSTTAMKLVVP
jgi:hypothetical protein